MGARGGSQKKIHKGEGAEQEGDGKKRRIERKGKQKKRKKRKNEPVQETGIRNKLETKSAGKALEEPTEAPRERSRIRLQRKEAEGRGNKYKHETGG